MKLYCMRHGDAENLASSNGERALSEHGQQDIAKIAAYLGHRGLHVSHVLRSDKLRAIQTADVLAQVISDGQPTELCALLGADHPVAPLMELIQTWNDDTMLVGHMPFMSQLVSALVLGDDGYTMMRFPPGTLVCLERHEQHRWLLNWVLRPDLVPDQGG